MKKIVLDIAITDASHEDVLEYVILSSQKPGKKLTIFTPNPEIIVYAAKHEPFQEILNHADISLCDGIGLFMAAKYLGKPLTERISGADFMENLCKRIVRKPITVGFLGAGAGVAERTAKCLQKKYPGLHVSFTGSDWDSETQARFEKSVVDILFVAYGFPKQEEWIADHIPSLRVKVAMAVGGSFDYISGAVSRAPFFVRAFGLEWLYRLIRQPWRLKRQLALLSFLKLVRKAKRSLV